MFLKVYMILIKDYFNKIKWSYNNYKKKQLK